MKFYAISLDYVNFLKKYDILVSDVEYSGRMKCFLGIVFNTDDGFEYFAPITSFKKKFALMNNNIDFL